MTYDVHLRRAEELGDDPKTRFEELLDADAEDVDLDKALADSKRPPTPQESAELETAVALLQKANPAFEPLGSPVTSTFVQLDDERPGGVLVNLSPAEIDAQVSYGTDDPAAAGQNLATCVRALTDAGWVAYDPQLERLVTGSEEDVRDSTALIARVHDDLLARYGGPPRRGILRRLLGR